MDKKEVLPRAERARDTEHQETLPIEPAFEQRRRHQAPHTRTEWPHPRQTRLRTHTREQEVQEEASRGRSRNRKGAARLSDQL